MIIKKFKVQKIEVVEKNQPDLALFLKTHFGDVPELHGRISGAIIEYVIQSGGSANVFDETLLIDEDFPDF